MSVLPNRAPASRKQQLRHLWFKVHKWLGLAFAVPVVLIFLSGSLLTVWRDILGGSTSAGPMRLVHILHGSLLLGRTGARAIGAIAFLLLLSAFSGLWLWWPMKGPLLRAMRWQRTQSANTNLHHQAGCWFAIPLAVLALTGASISFHGAFARVTSEDVERVMRRVHDGTGMPLIWQIIIFVTGLLGPVLGITGVIMWLRGRFRDRRMRRRRAGKSIRV